MPSLLLSMILIHLGFTTNRASVLWTLYTTCLDLLMKASFERKTALISGKAVRCREAQELVNVAGIETLCARNAVVKNASPRESEGPLSKLACDTGWIAKESITVAPSIADLSPTLLETRLLQTVEEAITMDVLRTQEVIRAGIKVLILELSQVIQNEIKQRQRR